MGITLKDIYEQRDMLRRGGEIARAAKQSEERERLRDTFAAAAFAGLLAQGDDGSFSEESYARSAYRWADAMLSVRDSRTADTKNLDAAPAARADADSARTDKAALRPGEGTGEGTGDTPAKRDTTPTRNGTPQDGSLQGEGSVPDSRIANEPVAWALICGDCVDSTFTDRDEAVEWASGIIPPAQIVPLYRHPPATLTDAERLGAANSGDDRRSGGGE